MSRNQATCLMALAILAIASLFTASGTLAGEIVRYRMPSGEIGFAQDRHSVPPGAEILEPGDTKKKGSLSIDPGPSPRREHARSSDDPLGTRSRPSRTRTPASHADEEEDEVSAYQKEIDERRSRAAEAQRVADDAASRDRRCDGGRRVGYGRDARIEFNCYEPSDAEYQEHADKLERELPSQLEEIEARCMADPNCSPRDLD